MIKSLKILIAPLDWGLGHTTRCLPLIHYLMEQGHEVIAAAEGASAMLLTANFPSLTVLPLKGYRIHYSKYKQLFAANILAQVPKIVKAIRREHAWLKHMQTLHRFDAIISDNRYGCYLSEVPSVLLTHQLQIQSGKGDRMDLLLRKWHYKQIEKFQQCWIVDVPQAGGLSGKLAHPDSLPANARYIGWLSQFSMRLGAEKVLEKTPYLLVLLSGPEPMRGQLETVLLDQLRDMSELSFVFVAGNPTGKAPEMLPKHIDYRSYLNASELRPLIEGAALVIGRSGYTTLMDLALMQKTALLIPTPGQTEQEYLADFLGTKGQALVRQQDEVVLSRDIPLALTCLPLGSGISGAQELMQDVIRDWLLQSCS